MQMELSVMSDLDDIKDSKLILATIYLHKRLPYNILVMFRTT